MDVTVNGERVEVAAGATIADLLARLGVRLEAVAVERNRSLVRRSEIGSTPLAPGDVLEVVTFVGGG
jgi:thiamine biosynthesis protein ThiS